ncbi:TPA: hypothetical protein ACH3X1_004144 [Trebouxia sp. C0004]
MQETCQFAMETTNGKDWSYSFEAERLSCSKRQVKTALTACKGIVSNTVVSLATSLPHVAKEPINTLKYITELGSHASNRPILQSLLAEASDKLAFIKQVSPHVYYGSGDGIRSSFCSHASSMGQCVPCQVLERHAATMYASRAHKKAESTMLTTRALIEQDASSLQVMASSSIPHQTLTGQEMRQRAAIQSSQRRADSQRLSRAKYSMLDFKAQIKVFASKAEQPGDDTPELIQLFTMVTESGALDDKQALEEVLLDIGQALLKGRKQRKISNGTQQLFMRVLNHSGSQVHDWLSKLLLGPDVRTTQKHRSNFVYPTGLGITEEHLDAVVKVLEAWNLLDCPMILSEDATAQQCRADVMGVNDETLIFGFTGPTLVVKTGADFKKLVEDKQASYATLLYVYTLVPLVPGAPYLPLFAFSHDGSKRTFTPALIKTIWRWIIQAFRRRGLNLIGFTFDGDARLRMSLYEMFRDATVGAPVGSTITISHPIIELFAVHPHPDRQMALLAFSDWLHIVFRLRRQMLEPARRLDIGGMLISLIPLKHMANKQKYRVSKSAMDFADKQCYEGALVLADFKTNTKAQDIKERGEVEEVRDVRDVLIKDDEFYGTYMYINFLHRSVIHTTRCTMQRRDTLALHILNTVLHKC